MKVYSKLLLFPLGLMLISWLKYFTSGTLMVDGHSVTPFWLRIICFLVMLITLIIYSLESYKMIQNESLNKKELYSFSMIAMVLSFLSLPLLSNDIFSTFGYADAYLQGKNIYLDPYASNVSVFKPYISDLYINATCKYGSLSMGLAALSLTIGGMKLSLSLLIYKLITMFFGWLYIVSSLQFSRKKATILLLFPLWFFQGVGQLHNEIFGIVFIIIGLYYIKKSWFITILCFVVATLFKLSFIVFLLLALTYPMYAYRKIFNARTIKNGFTALGLFSLSFITYLPFVDKPSELSSIFSSMNQGNTSSTFADIAAFVAQFIYNQDFTDSPIIINTFKVIGLLMMIALVAHFLKNYKKHQYTFVLLLQLYSVLFLVYSHRFLPWYVFLFTPLVIYVKNKDWLLWVFMIMIFSTCQDFSVFLQSDNLLGVITMVVATLAVVGSFFYKFKSRMLELKE